MEESHLVVEYKAQNIRSFSAQHAYFSHHLAKCNVVQFMNE